jgi:hypothetical protein
VPAPAALGGAALGFEGGDDLGDGEASGAELDDAVDGAGLVVDVLADAAAELVEGLGAAPAEGLAAEGDAARAELGERIARALGGGLALPLRDGGEDVQDEAAGGGARVDGVGDGEERKAGCEVSVDEIAEVSDGAREAVELGDDQAVGAAGVEELEGASEPGPRENLAERPASSNTATSSRSSATA